MSIQRLGVRMPEVITEDIMAEEYAYHEDSGMEYELYEVEDEFFIAASHDAVGLVTWYKADTRTAAMAVLEPDGE